VSLLKVSVSFEPELVLLITTIIQSPFYATINGKILLQKFITVPPPKLSHPFKGKKEKHSLGFSCKKMLINYKRPHMLQF
jgi:hypothetical protein